VFFVAAAVTSVLESRVRCDGRLMPTTFHEIRSKNPEITGRWDRPEWNIAAGIAYSRQLWDGWTNDSVVDHLREFMLASYNAGRLTRRRAGGEKSFARSHAVAKH
jgi:soluble lytic murein transglycosylase-like protein